MAQTVPKLPDDIDALKALVLVNQQQLAAKDNHIAILEEKLRLASKKRFGACLLYTSPSPRDRS